MSEHYESRGNPLLYSTTINYYGPPASTYHSSSSSGVLPYRYYASKSDTVRRTRPEDLFGNATDLFRFSYEINESSGTETGGNSALRFSFTAPCSYWISNGEPSLASLIGIYELDGLLRSRIKSQNLNLAQSLAEYRQASSMFANLARDVVRTVRKLKRPEWAFADFIRYLQKPRTRKEQDLANRWLEIQYGWKPLISDLYGVSEALAVKIQSGMYRYVSTQREIVKGDALNVSPFVSNWEVTDRLRVRARYKIQDEGLKSLSQLGFTNPLLLAWELIPFSFVVDWAIPVGDWLSSLDALNGTSDLRVIRSYTRMSKSMAGAWGGTFNYKSKSYSRYVGGTLALPSLGYKPSKSLTAVANGLALLKQLKGR